MRNAYLYSFCVYILYIRRTIEGKEFPMRYHIMISVLKVIITILCQIIATLISTIIIKHIL
jgi:hypothetical protein